ncbi:MAG: flagellar basal body rod protein FlgC [Candidatus Sumerlaeia bacterium]
MYELLPMEIAASGMSAQRLRMGVVSSNLANARSTRTPDGEGPYKKRRVVFEANTLPAFEDLLINERLKKPGQPLTLSESWGQSPEYEEVRRQVLELEPERSTYLLEEHLRGVDVPEIAESDDVQYVYDPAHPDADPETGMVAFPDIQVVSEMTDLIAASRNYEANLSVLKGTKDMILQLTEMLRS